MTLHLLFHLLNLPPLHDVFDVEDKEDEGGGSGDTEGHGHKYEKFLLRCQRINGCPDKFAVV